MTTDAQGAALKRFSAAPCALFGGGDQYQPVDCECAHAPQALP